MWVTQGHRGPAASNPDASQCLAQSLAPQGAQEIWTAGQTDKCRARSLHTSDFQGCAGCPRPSETQGFHVGHSHQAQRVVAQKPHRWRPHSRTLAGGRSEAHDCQSPTWLLASLSCCLQSKVRPKVPQELLLTPEVSEVPRVAWKSPARETPPGVGPTAGQQLAQFCPLSGPMPHAPTVTCLAAPSQGHQRGPLHCPPSLVAAACVAHRSSLSPWA